MREGAMVKARGRSVPGLLFVFMAALIVGGLAGGSGGTVVEAAERDFLATIVVALDPVVSGGTVTLGEIARIESADGDLKSALEAVSIGRAPLPGQVRLLNEARLRVLLRRERLPESQIAILGLEGNVAISARSEQRAILVAATDLGRHEALAPHLVETVMWESARIPDGALPADWAPQGGWENWRTTRPVRAGTPLELDRMEPRPDATRGQTVTVVVRHGVVEVVAEGVLEEDAQVGQSVNVRMPGGEVVSARLVALGKAELQVDG